MIKIHFLFSPKSLMTFMTNDFHDCPTDNNSIKPWPNDDAGACCVKKNRFCT